MTDQHPALAPRQRQLAEVLLGYLESADLAAWPGVEGMSILDILLTAYAGAAAAGHVPGRADLLRKYPALAADVEDFFAGRWPAPGGRASGGREPPVGATK